VAGLHLATTDAADESVASDALTLVGVLLDLQIPMEQACTSPEVLPTGWA
jgi:hypothetical protein